MYVKDILLSSVIQYAKIDRDFNKIVQYFQLKETSVQYSWNYLVIGGTLELTS